MLISNWYRNSQLHELRQVLPVLILSMTVKVLVTLSCPTLCYLMDCSPPASSVHEILQTRILEWVAIPFSRDWTWVSRITGRFFTVWATREAHCKTDVPMPTWAVIKLKKCNIYTFLWTFLRSLLESHCCTWQYLISIESREFSSPKMMMEKMVDVFSPQPSALGSGGA